MHAFDGGFTGLFACPCDNEAIVAINPHTGEIVQNTLINGDAVDGVFGAAGEFAMTSQLNAITLEASSVIVGGQSALLMDLSVQSHKGVKYDLMFKRVLSDVWHWLGSFVGSGSDEKMPLPVDSEGAGYYRVATSLDDVQLHLRLPLPAAKRWLLTTEAGGADCAVTTINAAHQSRNYYSLDFDDFTFEDGPEPGAAVLAAASGKVIFASTSEDPLNGYYVVIAHNGKDDETGYTTRYLHMESDLKVRTGSSVVQGQRLGRVGETGTSKGSHLHFGVRFNNSGDSTVPELDLVRLEGLRLTDYKTECIGATRTRYYLSTNIEP